MKNKIFHIIIVLYILMQGCKESPPQPINENSTTPFTSEIIELTQCSDKTAELIVDKHQFQLSDSIKIQYLINTLENLDTIKDDGRIIFGDTIIFNCKPNSDLVVFINQDYIKFNNQKYEPNTKLAWELRKLEGEAFVRKRLKQVLSKIDSTTKLSLRDCSLDSIPSEIFKLRNLEFLDLSLNIIKNVPDGISELKNLKELSLSYNLIDKISPQISKLQQLETLWLLDNKLNSIPDKICELKKLKELNLNGNQIEELPSCIPNMESLKKLAVGTWEDKDQSKKVLKQIEEFKRINENLNIRG